MAKKRPQCEPDPICPRAVFVCAPLEAPAPRRTGGVFKIKQPDPYHEVACCEACDREVWIGPLQLAASKTSGGEVVCIPCAEPEASLLSALDRMFGYGKWHVL